MALLEPTDETNMHANNPSPQPKLFTFEKALRTNFNNFYEHIQGYKVKISITLSMQLLVYWHFLVWSSNRVPQP
jgi:hypothetical protein